MTLSGDFESAAREFCIKSVTLNELQVGIKYFVDSAELITTRYGVRVKTVIIVNGEKKILWLPHTYSQRVNEGNIHELAGHHVVIERREGNRHDLRIVDSTSTSSL